MAKILTVVAQNVLIKLQIYNECFFCNHRDLMCNRIKVDKHLYRFLLNVKGNDAKCASNRIKMKLVYKTTVRNICRAANKIGYQRYFYLINIINTIYNI